MIAASVRSSEGSTSTAVEICRRISPWTARSDCSLACRAAALRRAEVRTAVTIRSVTGRSGARSIGGLRQGSPEVEGQVRRDARQPFVADRDDHDGRDASSVEGRRPGQPPARPVIRAGEHLDRLAHRREEALPRRGHGLGKVDREIGVRDRGRLGPEEGRRRGVHRPLGGVEHGAKDAREVRRPFDGIAPARQVPHPADQGGEGAGRRVGAPAAPGERAIGGLLELPRRERLDEVVHRPETHRPLHGVERRVRRDHDDLDVGIDRLHPLEELDAVDPRHLDVHEDDVRPETREDRQDLVAARGRVDLMARLQDHPDGLTRALLVVDDQNARLSHSESPWTLTGRSRGEFGAASRRTGSRPPVRRAPGCRRGPR